MVQFLWLDTYKDIRGQDSWGNGAFGASRDNGKRVHKGADVCFQPDEDVKSIVEGVVSKLGYPYADPAKAELRYVEVVTPANERVRYFYCKPCVKVGDTVYAGTIVGKACNLGKFYPKMTNHVHIEIIVDGEYKDPTNYFE